MVERGAGGKGGGKLKLTSPKEDLFPNSKYPRYRNELQVEVE